MDPQIKAYFIRILNTISITLLWMLINVTAGIKYNLAFVEDHVSWKNIVFYCWLTLSFVVLLWRLYKIWNKPLHIDL
jgi:hypothetical protein